MKAVVMRAFGGPEELVVAEVPRPEPGLGEVLVRVRACGVCYHDVLNRAGRLGRPPLPAILGHEAAGEVAAVGPGVTDLKIGQRVVLLQRNICGRCRYCYSGQDHLCRQAGLFGEGSQGGYAEYMAARSNACVPLPASIPFEEAAVLACGVATALHALRRGRVTLGENVLITGASGGIGAHAIQLARLAGARVIAVTTSSGKVGMLEELGAEVVVAPDGQFSGAVRRLTGGAGVDCVIEITGAPTLNTSLRSVRLGGRVVIVGNVDPQDVPFNPGLAILKELDILGSDANSRRELEEAVDLVARGAIRPIVGEVLRLEEAHVAHSRLQERKAAGRIVLSIP